MQLLKYSIFETVPLQFPRCFSRFYEKNYEKRLACVAVVCISLKPSGVASAVQAPVKGGKFGTKLTLRRGFWLNQAREKTSILWLARTRLRMKIYDTAFQWVHLSSYNKASIDNNFECDWKPVNKGTTQSSVRGPYRPYLFKMFLNNLNITLGNHDALFKNADDSTIIAPVWKDWHYSDQLVSPFLDWTKTNGMSCNPSKQNKCKELTTRAIMALVDNQKER